ncbi:MAG: hypothetical protein KKD44_26035 [Proteobacteria bacterium]|nr:hypothetical protein [Pseudomonadota bacterium]
MTTEATDYRARIATLATAVDLIIAEVGEEAVITSLYIGPTAIFVQVDTQTAQALGLVPTTTVKLTDHYQRYTSWGGVTLTWLEARP